MVYAPSRAEVVAIPHGECSDQASRRTSSSSIGGEIGGGRHRPRRRPSGGDASRRTTRERGGPPLVAAWEELEASRSPAFSEHILSVSGKLRSGSLPAMRRLGVELRSMLDVYTASEAAAAGGGGGLIFAAPRAVETRPLEWDARLPGPEGTPYAGGIFRLAFEFPETYPLKPPKVRFVTTCFHPNVSVPEGQICLNVLTHEWSPLLTVSTLLLCISALLSQPNPEDPLNERAASLLHHRPLEYARVAYEWTRRFAAA